MGEAQTQRSDREIVFVCKPVLSGQFVAAAFQFSVAAAITHNSDAPSIPGPSVKLASFNWLIFWWRAG